MTSSAEKVLIIGPAWIGDMVMANSLFRCLKHQNPHHTLTVLSPGWSLPILARMSEVDQAMALPFAHGELKLGKRWRFGTKLQSQQFDRAIVLPNSWKSAIIPWAARIPHRTGWLGEARYGLLNDARKLDRQRYPSMISRFNALAYEPLFHPIDTPKPTLHASAEQQAQTQAAFKVPAKAYVALCPGAEFGAAKRWPPQHYATLCIQVLDYGLTPVLMGSPKDAETAQHIIDALRTKHSAHQAILNVVGKTSLEQAVDILAGARAVVTNDSGLMHIAAAVGCPLIAIYGPTSSVFTPPASDSAIVLQTQLHCQPCHKRQCPLPPGDDHHACMLNLTPNNVWTQLQAVLSP